MNYRDITSCLLLLLISCHSASCIICYYCAFGDVPANDPKCENPTPETAPLGRNAGTGKSVFELPDEFWKPRKQSGMGRKLPRDVCVALFGTFNGRKALSRAKGDRAIPDPNGCYRNVDYTSNGVRFLGEACLCDTDYCNGENDRASYGPITDIPVSEPQSQPPPISSGRLLTIGVLTPLLTTATMIAFPA